MTNEESSELAQPGVGAFDDPSSFMKAQLEAEAEPIYDPGSSHFLRIRRALCFSAVL
jgi:hypothetical protein